MRSKFELDESDVKAACIAWVASQQGFENSRGLEAVVSVDSGDPGDPSGRSGPTVSVTVQVCLPSHPRPAGGGR